MKSFLKCLALILCFTFIFTLLPADVSAADKPVGGVTAVGEDIYYNTYYSAYSPIFDSLYAVDTEGNQLSNEVSLTCLYQEYNSGQLLNKVNSLKYDTPYYTALYIHNPEGNKHIDSSLVNISIPGYKVMYWDSSLQDGGATVRIVYKVTRIGVYVGGVAIADGYYLAEGADNATVRNPGDHYAYLEDGVLTLHNYTHNVTNSNGDDIGILSNMDLTVKFEGTNTITTDGVGIRSEGGNLRIEGTVNDSLTIHSKGIGIAVKQNIVLDPKGTLNINSEKQGISCSEYAGHCLDIKSGNINIISYWNCIWLGDHDLTVSGGKVEMLNTSPGFACIYNTSSLDDIKVTGGEMYLTCEGDVIFNGKFSVSGGKVLMRSCDEESGMALNCSAVDIASSLTTKASTKPYGTLSAYEPSKNDSYKLITIGNPADKVYSYKITYDANGGTGYLAPQTVRLGESVTLPDNPYKAPANNDFFGWICFGNNTFETYEVGEVLEPREDMTLKAYWAEKITKVDVLVKNPVVGMMLGDAYVYEPDGANYFAEIDYWYGKNADGVFYPNPTDTFEKGEYRLRLEIIPNLGYYFDNTTVFTVNGKPTTNYSLNPNTFHACREVAFDVDDFVNPFTDVHETDYFYDPVMWAVKNGVTTGMTPTTFGPEAGCTRAHAVTFLWRAMGCPEPGSAAMPFKDVDKGSYYEKAVQWAVEEGITAGTSATTFSPDANCERGQIVTFLWRLAGEPAPSSMTTPFTDVEKGGYYEKAVLWAVEEGITNGMTPTTFGPAQQCTRGQIVTFLYRFIEG